MGLKEFVKTLSPGPVRLSYETATKPPLQPSVAPLKPVSDKERALLDEHIALAARLGVAAPVGDVENFKRWLRQNEFTVFALAEVIAYMDKKAEEESAARAGWHWVPLREIDQIDGARFGKPAIRWQDGIHAASDYYEGPRQEVQTQVFGGGPSGIYREPRTVDGSAAPYSQTIPLSALRKIDKIEREYDGDVSFFVSDYAPAPAFRADPFLMAVVPNPKLHLGEGRFVIDFWDEPSFGIEQMLLSDV